MHRQGHGGRLAACILLLSALALGGCASTPDAKRERSDYDPLEGLNRTVFAFNMAADRAVLRPVARGYDTVTPRPVKLGVANFMDNLGTPVWALNHLLQGQFGHAGMQTLRFLLNSTVGWFGLFDPASDAGLGRNSANFNQTFGKWGVPSGPYLMLPLMGPSSVRGGVAVYANYETNMMRHAFDHNRSVRDKLVVLDVLDSRRRLLPFDRMLDEAPDPYILVREAYRQRVEFEIHGQGSDDDIALDFEDEDWGDE
jgi:phospholipid-binding lipoprotein MlaA